MIESYSPGVCRVFKKLAALIALAEKSHQEACLNSGTAAQVFRNGQLDDYKHAFAVATGTIIGGMHFNQLLKEATAYKPPVELDPMEADAIRFEARGRYLDGDDDVTIAENAKVEKVDGGYWVDARVWIYD